MQYSNHSTLNINVSPINSKFLSVTPKNILPISVESLEPERFFKNIFRQNVMQNLTNNSLPNIWNLNMISELFTKVPVTQTTRGSSGMNAAGG